MKKFSVIIILVLISISCKEKTFEKEISKLEIAKSYYKCLDNSDVSGIATILNDSLFTKETEYDYEQTFSLEEYVEWVKWDSVFEPTYKILQVKQEGEIVKARISKTDKRVLFLHEEPIVTNQVIRFHMDKISSIETTKYVIFNDTTFIRNRNRFLNWIDENHPELKGFIHDQTKNGGLKYLKAIDLFKKEN
ncbi:hypothetical protein [uncultured Algibacter sp.]|uniref:hypothetical protein n=1 Tax=uncultured Algibacter sp. TaxID=298659 RepID=UPI0026283B0A|nr:hypothetical protein [uncultured Algibacter sp.]